MNTNNYNSAINPYIFGKPIDKKKQLYGREKTIEQIKSNLINNKQITLLEVQRRIGKSSLLKCLPQFMTGYKSNFKFVNFSFQGEQHYEIPKILDHLAEKIIEDIGGIPEEVKKLANNLDTFFGEFLPKIINTYLSGEKVVFLLDEFDVLGEDEETYSQGKGKDLFDNLKKAVERENRLFAILVFGKPVKKINYLESFWKQDPEKSIIRVTELDKKSTEKLIREPAEGQLEYEPEAIDAIWKLLKGHPSLTQLLCKSIFEYCDLNKINRVTSHHVSLSQKNVMTRGGGVLKGFLIALNEPEQLFLKAVAEAQEIGIIDPLKIIKQTKKRQNLALINAGKLLVEYGFLEKYGRGYKIKVELVRIWLLKNHPLLDEKERKRRKTVMSKTPTNPPNRPPSIEQFVGFLAIVITVGTLGLFVFSRILISENPRRTESECFNLSQQINKALGDTRKQSEVIEKVRSEWSREKESLDKQCPYSDYELDAKYNTVLHYYGRTQVDAGKFDLGIEAFCEITSEYQDFPKIKTIFKRWVLIDNRLSDENTIRVLEKIIEQNQSGNDCLAYSFKNDRNKDELYDQKAQVHTEAGQFIQAVESYCKITNNYYNKESVVKKLEKWVSDEYYQDGLTLNDTYRVEEKLKELKNQCSVFPLSLDN